MGIIFDIVLDAIIDTALLVPFLLITYLVMEWIEHKTSDAIRQSVGQAGASGPIVGAVMGIVPQCGFSAATATLYSARVVSIGTLLAVFLSTSDKMLPIFIAEHISAGTVIGMLGIKLVVAIAVGLAVDALFRHRGRTHDRLEIHDLCEEANCYCEERCEGMDVQAVKEAEGPDHVHEHHDDEHCHHEHGAGSIVKSALKHTAQVTLFVFLVTLALNVAFDLVGEEALTAAFAANAWLAIPVSAVVGLIPNCAASVAIAQLFVEGVITTGACLAGLLPAAGVGILVLLRTNKRHMKENLAILGALVVIGMVVGALIDLVGIAL